MTHREKREEMVVRAGTLNHLFTIPEDRVPQVKLDQFSDRICRMPDAYSLNPERVSRSKGDGVSSLVKMGGACCSHFYFQSSFDLRSY